MERAYILITGGAGFIGTNLACSYLERSEPVHIFDNLSRPGSERNIAELRRRYPGRVLFTNGDVRSSGQIATAVESARAIYHLAAQVAVTSSLEDPAYDAAVNLCGTLHLLEGVRALSVRPPLLFTSTNKVYGGLGGLAIDEAPLRYQPRDQKLVQEGVDESCALDFLSPYGCSKGSADQYVLDYARSFNLPATVFRMSCIYGPYQLGSEDQGWVAHFARRMAKGEPITIFGKGKQVRDLLYVTDLVRAMQSAMGAIHDCAGEAFNIGGGAANSASLLEILRYLEHLTGALPRIENGPERLGDQRWYVSNTAKARRVFGWYPETSLRTGLSRLLDWYNQHPELISHSGNQVEAQCASR